jgi:hypothetical protein
MAAGSVQRETARPELGPRPRSATISLVLGIVALVASVIPIAGILLGVAAAVKSAGAIDDIRSQFLDGIGFALAGLILGVLAVVAAFWFIVVGGITR